MSVSVRIILQRKGADVVTVASDVSIADAAEVLKEHNIGALVVSDDGESVAGIISERDIVRQLVEDGPGTLGLPVAEVMTAEVSTCGPDDQVDDLMGTMTTSRIRHLPVMEDGRLSGIVSIGDVVKSRIDDLEIQAQSLKEYVTGSGY